MLETRFRATRTRLRPNRKSPPAKASWITHLVAATSIALAVLLFTIPAAALGIPSTPSKIAPSTGALFGSTGDGSMSVIKERETYFGRKFDIDHDFIRWDDVFPTERQIWDIQNGRIPMISWSRTYSSKINNGVYDTLIRTRAKALKGLGKPVLLRWAWEPTVKRWRDKSGTPSAYISAWRRLHKLFAAVGATNVEWIWCMTAMDFKTGDAKKWYPGDAYVDWVATDGYSWYPVKQTKSDKWRTFSEIFSAFYSVASKMGKPLMIAEYGVQEDPNRPGRKADWVNDHRSVLKNKFTRIKAVVYFDNKTSNKGRPTFDWRMDTSASAYKAFKAMAQDAYFNRRR